MAQLSMKSDLKHASLKENIRKLLTILKTVGRRTIPAPALLLKKTSGFIINPEVLLLNYLCPFHYYNNEGKS